MLPDYSKGKIYKLVSNKTNDVYIGSCLMTLSTRLSKHKNKSNQTSSKKLFIDDAIITIVLIEACPCNSKNELKARELFHITNTLCINANKPFISESTGKEWAKEYSKEYFNTHKEQVLEYRKAHYESNKEQILEQSKIYNEANKEQIKEYVKIYSEANKEKLSEYNKAYNNTNKEQIKEKNKIFYEANKEKISIRCKELYQIKKALKAQAQTA